MSLTAVVFTTLLGSLFQCSTNLTVKSVLLMSSLSLPCLFCAIAVLLLVIGEQRERKQRRATQTYVLSLLARWSFHPCYKLCLSVDAFKGLSIFFYCGGPELHQCKYSKRIASVHCWAMLCLMPPKAWFALGCQDVLLAYAEPIVTTCSRFLLSCSSPTLSLCLALLCSKHRTQHYL